MKKRIIIKPIPSFVGKKAKGSIPPALLTKIKAA